MAGATYRDLKLCQRLMHLIRPYWPYIAGVLLFELLAIPLALLMPLPLKIAVDSVVGTHPLPERLDALLPPVVKDSASAILILAAALAIAIAGLNQAQQLLSVMLRAYAGEKMLMDLRSQLFRRAHQLSPSYHDTKGTADCTYRIHHDSYSIRYIAFDGTIPLVTAGLTVVGMIYVTARINWQLAAVALAISPLVVLISHLNRQSLRRRWRKEVELEASAFSLVQEVLGALRVVKAFGQEDREEGRYIREATAGMRARLGAVAVDTIAGLLVGLTAALGTAAVLYVGVTLVRSGAVTLGELLLVMGYLSQLYEPLKKMSKEIASLQFHISSTERVFALLDEPSGVVERPNARPISRIEGIIEFRDVSFTYSEGRPVLHHVSFDIEPWSRVGIVGVTGSGKTTLLNLLTRFYDPTDGQILLDGIDLRHYKLADLRSQFAIVLQEPVLLSTSIAENIAYARPGAQFWEIVEAAKAARIHEFVRSLPEGYDTLVGERGMSLSGGERQRISLARAFLKDAPILILDEPTSAVDTGTEAEIMAALEELVRGRTSIIITHRPSTLKSCDVVLKIENGHLRHTRLKS
ncbi:MAG: ABC transporter ATP-binding protein [Chloroflexi bacterium]|nr:ABC transporter ATP-binding protein [Chloroflexota bacterium]